jgi:hypothetical protein
VEESSSKNRLLKKKDQDKQGLTDNEEWEDF